MKPTFEQLSELFAQEKDGRVTRENPQAFLRDPNSVFDLIVSGGSKAIFPIWKTIKLGLRKDANAYRHALEAAGCRIGYWADDILGRIVFSATEKEVNLVVRSVAELGFANGATLRDIYRRATELGLTLCLAEVGPALRAQYRDQPLDEWLVIAMKPEADSDGVLGVFNVERVDDGLWLNSDYGGPASFWRAYVRFVFVSGKCS